MKRIVLLLLAGLAVNAYAADTQQKLAPNVTSTWEGQLMPDGAAPGPGERIAFSVTTDALGAPTVVNLQVTARSAVLDGANELQCFAGDLVTGSADARETFEIFPAGDGFAFVFSDDTPDGGLNGEAFFSNVNGSGILEGNGFDLVTGDPIDLDLNEAQGNVNFNFLYSLLPEQSCGDSIFAGGTCSEPCSWLWEAQCVSNCDGAGELRIERSSYEVDETAGSISINLVRVLGSIGEVSVDYRTEIIPGGAASGLDYTFTSGTATWADGDASPKVVTIPILTDVPIEGPEDFLLVISNPTGNAELGSITSATITIEDRPDLTVTDLMVDMSTLTLNGDRYEIPSVTATVSNIAEGGQAATNVVVNVTDTLGSFFLDIPLPDLAPGQSTPLDFVYDATSALTRGAGFAQGNELLVTVDPFSVVPERRESNNEARADAEADVRPVVELMPTLTLEDHFFLRGPPASNLINALVDWNGPQLAGNGSAPFGEVTFDLNGSQQMVSGTATGAMITYDMGSDLMTGFGCDNNSLIVHAEQGSFVSEPVAVNTTSFDLPLWVLWLISNIPGADGDFTSQVAAPIVKYLYAFVFPDPPFNALVVVPNLVPYLGGEMLGILDTQGGVNVLAESSGSGVVSLSGETGVAVASLEIVGTLTGEGQVQFKCSEGLDLLATTFGLDITGSVTREQPLLEVIPGASVLTGLPLVGDFFEAVFEGLVISGKIGARAAITATFEPDAEGALEFASGTGRLGVPTSATLTLMFANGMASVTGGGEPFVEVKFPAPYFDRAGVDLVLRGELEVYGYGAGFERLVTCALPGGCSFSDIAVKLRLTSATLILLPRDHLLAKDYARFAPQARKTLVNAADTETTLVTSTLDRSRVSLATGSNGRTLVYVHDDPADPDGRSTEIRALRFDGSSWQPPETLADNTAPEFAPDLAYDSAGNVVVVWERATLPGTDPLTEYTEAFARSMELYSSTWNGTSWSAPVAVTSNNEMDHAVKLASGADDSVMALWQRHGGASLAGTAANPISLLAAPWNGSLFEAPRVVASGLTALRTVAFAQRNAAEAVVVFAQNLGLAGDVTGTELYLSSFDGATWSAPARLTDDALADSAPAVAYDASGLLHLVWIRNGELVWLRDSTDLADLSVIQTDSGDGGLLNLELLADATGNLGITWPLAAGETTDPGLIIYDAANGVWGEAQPLIRDAAVEGPLSAAFAGDGSLQLAYLKTAITLEDETVASAGTGEFEVTGVPTRGATDLAYLIHPLGADGTVGGLRINPGNLLPGQGFDLEVGVMNSGDLEIGALTVEIYQNDQLLDTQVVTDLKAGQTQLLTIPGTLSQETRQHFRAVVDPLNAVTEK
ncbi:MAG: CARDB domain-containing protein, partial [Pseudomonadota bacterium]